MKKICAGIIPFRIRNNVLEVFLVHSGGPFYSELWGIAKGGVKEGEAYIDAAIREFTEETGIEPLKQLIELSSVNQSNKKIVYPWAVRMDIDPSIIISNTFSCEYPIGSGIIKEFPEVDKGEWFTLDEAREKIITGQIPILDELLNVLIKNYEESLK